MVGICRQAAIIMIIDHDHHGYSACLLLAVKCTDKTPIDSWEKNFEGKFILDFASTKFYEKS